MKLFPDTCGEDDCAICTTVVQDTLAVLFAVVVTAALIARWLQLH